ncbi:MAG: 2Fe-2S iron-sulfur cluster-binding protein [Planctomycetota bacterium]
MSLYERLGGAPAFIAATDEFYRRMLTDDRVASFFDGIDMDAQIAKQRAFLTYVTGGPAEYTGKDMRVAHAELVKRGLDSSHVDVVIGHLGAHPRDPRREAGGHRRGAPAGGERPKRRLEPMTREPSASLRLEGRSIRLRAGESVLEALEREGVDTPSGCRAGTCT